MMTRICPGPSTSEPTVSRQSNGVGKALPVSSPPRGISRLSPKSTWARPIVATSSVSLGPRDIGRITSTSIVPLRTIAPRRASGIANQYGQLLLSTRIGIRTAGSAPISPVAKLSTWVVR